MRAATAPALAFLLVVLVVLPGCASPPARPFTPADLPAETSAGQASPGGTPGAGDDASRPGGGPRTETVRVAPGLRLVVEWPAAPDADTAAMIGAFRDYFAGTLRAVASGGDDTAYRRLVEGEASRHAYSWVQEFLDEGRSLRGTMRLYALNVSAVVGAGAQLDMCVDQARLSLLDSATGREITWGDKGEPFLQAAGMRRYDGGVWKIKALRHAVLPSERAKGCIR
ncbi:hypothetical protein FHS43_000884 [Streptosporangium becharense]|uniref:SnoaL-like domain-containing protein n=1 Tax=Streptosporangium becharense TaxID=1816182 RepID=A0A7W9IF70_9ACTN|nr:hypothetical protein [Streptosporangium becharense]MBB2909638.1 hypothetical protein [Streptosporangium becharense]MBB5819406.1 hypothetical protein [Streptosporangium becharense]